MKRLLIGTLGAVAVMGLVSTAGAAVITITFDNVPADIKCDEVWYEQGIAMWFTTAVAGECGEGSCYFGVDTPGEVWLYPSTLAIDLSNITGIDSIEADYLDYCGGPGCENAYLYAGETLVDEDHSDSNPLIVETGGSSVDLLRINGCEDAFTEIRIIGEILVPVASSTWGQIRSIYR